MLISIIFLPVVKEKRLIAGDTLFRRAVGRTDLWDGDFSTVKWSIQQRLYILDEETVLVAGHGCDMTIGEEVRENQVINGIDWPIVQKNKATVLLSMLLDDFGFTIMKNLTEKSDSSVTAGVLFQTSG